MTRVTWKGIFSYFHFHRFEQRFGIIHDNDFMHILQNIHREMKSIGIGDWDQPTDSQTCIQTDRQTRKPT